MSALLSYKGTAEAKAGRAGAVPWLCSLHASTWQPCIQAAGLAHCIEAIMQAAHNLQKLTAWSAATLKQATLLLLLV